MNSLLALLNVLLSTGEPLISFLIFEFELLYDIGNCIYNVTTENEFLYIPQTINFENDKDDFEQFMISIIVMDVEEDNDKLYNDKDLLNKINNLIYRK